MAVGTVRKPPAVFHGFHSQCEGEKGEVAFSLRRLAAALCALFSPFCGNTNEIRKIFIGLENQLREIVYRGTVNTEYGFGKGFTD